ncbi:MAG TPA: hypothetical protein PKD53_04745 [Chloroflexaceae bacterium]|nr:hypothetical protein [Chloroflexaceae bacterium]
MGRYSRGSPQRHRPTAEAAERQAAIRHALATGDVGPIRVWARRWLADTSTVDAADDASLLQSARDAARIGAELPDRDGLQAMEDACAAVARDLVAQPPAVAERLIVALERSQAPDPLRRALDRLIAAQARRLLGAPAGLLA